MAKAGRPTKYDPKVTPLVCKWMARNGLTDIEMSKELGVSKSIFNKWKTDYPEFLDSLKEGKSFVDNQVIDKLLTRAMGYEYKEKTVEYTPSGEGKGKIKTVKETTKQIVPDVTAQIFWLKNRQPRDWRDKQDIEHSGQLNTNITGFNYIIPEPPK